MPDDDSTKRAAKVRPFRKRRDGDRADAGCTRCGRDTCEGCAPGAPSFPRRWRTADDVIREPDPEPVVDGIAWPGRVTLLTAESGAGKTFVLLDLAAGLARDRWHGRRVQAGSVAYASWEGDLLNRRLLALRERGADLAHVFLLSMREALNSTRGDGATPGELLLSEQVRDLAAHLEETGAEPLRLLVLDTLRASMAGSEDSSEHASAYLRAVRRIADAAPTAAVLVAHHTGWQDGEAKHRRARERGSSAFRGNTDHALYLAVSKRASVADPIAYLSLDTPKLRDELPGPPLRLQRRRVQTSIRNRHGEPVTSCVIEPDDRDPATVEAEEHAERTAHEQAKRAELETRVLDLCRRRPITSKVALREQLNVGAAPLRDALANLLAAGRLIHEGQRQPFRVAEDSE